MNCVHYFKLKVENPNDEIFFFKSLAEIIDDESLVAVGDFMTYEILYTFFEKTKVIELENLFSTYNVLIESRDLTDKILSCDYQDTEFLEVFSDSIHQKMLRNFIIQNLDTDRILDKISKFGIDSLTEIEKEILDNT